MKLSDLKPHQWFVLKNIFYTAYVDSYRKLYIDHPEYCALGECDSTKELFFVTRSNMTYWECSGYYPVLIKC